MIKAWPKQIKAPEDFVVIDTTTNYGPYKELSPFVLSARKYGSINFENLWQFSKVYCPEHTVSSDFPPYPSWDFWRIKGFSNPRAVRYPMKRGRKPAYSYWKGEKLDYVKARKKIYIPIYAELVLSTKGFQLLARLCESEPNVALLDYDAYDHRALGMSLKDVANCPTRKCGHAFVLLALLTDSLWEMLDD